MAAATYNVTVNADVNKVWRKIQGDLQTALQFGVEEFDMSDELQGGEFDIDWSAREITVPLDINEGAGVASIPEGGYEARPSSPNVEEITLNWIVLNGRFTISKQAMWIDQRNSEAMIERQFVHQGKHKVRDIQRAYGDYFYGFSTAILALTDTNLSGTSGVVITLKNGLGSSLIPGTTQAQKDYICSLFKVNDHIAVLNAGTLVTNGIGKITAINESTPSITVTFNGAVSESTNDLQIVKANSLENATVAGGTDYNRGLVGRLDSLTSASLHSLTHDNWVAALADTGGGRFTFTKLRKARQAVSNRGGGKIDTILIAQGVLRDVEAQERAGLRWDSPMNMELDSSIKAKGVRFFDSRRVPPGMVDMYARKSFKRMTLLPKPGRPAWGDAEKIQDISGFVFPMDYPCALVTLNRLNQAYVSGATEAS